MAGAFGDGFNETGGRSNAGACFSIGLSFTRERRIFLLSFLAFVVDSNWRSRFEFGFQRNRLIKRVLTTVGNGGQYFIGRRRGPGRRDDDGHAPIMARNEPAVRYTAGLNDTGPVNE